MDFGKKMTLEKEKKLHLVKRKWFFLLRYLP